MFQFHRPSKLFVPLTKLKCERRMDIGDGQYRVDTHPRLSRDGRMVSIDASHEVRAASRLMEERAVDRCNSAWDYPTMIVTLDAKRRFCIPAALAPASPGDQFDASFDSEEDVVILRRVKRKAKWLEVWKKCPVPMDDVPPRSRELPKKVKS